MNTRAAYPINYVENIQETWTGGEPQHYNILTVDALGVMPSISKLNTEEAIYHFMSGYTSKVSGTERGITEPQATFSACFGEPFMLLNPTIYANLLGEKIALMLKKKIALNSAEKYDMVNILKAK